MATTGKFNGDIIGIYNGSDLIAYATASTISIGNTIIDTTDKDSEGWATNLEGVKNWGMNLDAGYAMDASMGANDLIDLLLTGDSEFTAKWGNAVVGDTYFEGSVRIENLEISAPHNEKATFTCSLVGNGIVTKGTVAS